MNRREAIIALCSGLLGTAFGMHFALWLKQFLSRRPPAPQNLRLKEGYQFQTDVVTNCPSCGHFWLRDYGYTFTHCPACGYLKPVYRKHGQAYVTLNIKKIPDERLPRALPPTWTVKGL